MYVRLKLNHASFQDKQPSWQAKNQFAEEEKSPECPIYLNIKLEKMVNFYLYTLTYALSHIFFFIRKWSLKHEPKVEFSKLFTFRLLFGQFHAVKIPLFESMLCLRYLSE